MTGWQGLFMAVAALGRIRFIMAETGHICPGGRLVTGGTLAVKMSRRLLLTMARNTVCRSSQHMVRCGAFESALVVTKSTLHLEMVFRPALEMAAQTIGGLNQLMVEMHLIPHERAVAVGAVAFIMRRGTDSRHGTAGSQTGWTNNYYLYGSHSSRSQHAGPPMEIGAQLDLG